MSNIWCVCVLSCERCIQRVSWCPCQMLFECGAPFGECKEEDNVFLV